VTTAILPGGRAQKMKYEMVPIDDYSIRSPLQTLAIVGIPYSMTFCFPV